MINPDGLLEHARRLAGQGRGRPPEADLRRGISAAYYAVFHDLTDRAARHLIGSAPASARDALRRTWSHGELAAAAEIAVERAKTTTANPRAPATGEIAKAGPLADLAANDTDLVNALRLFSELQEKRHQADYEHNARYEKLTLLDTCRDAASARALLGSASSTSREALFTLLTVRRRDFQPR